MRFLLLALLTACAGDVPDTDIDPDSDTSADTDTDTDPAPATDLLGRWTVPDFDVLPGQADRLWCADAEVGDYEDETWRHNGEPVTCHEGSVGGCFNDLEFFEDGTVIRWVMYGADGPCPFDGVSHQVIAWEPWGTWSLVSTDGTTDTYEVDGVSWSVRELGDGMTLAVQAPGADFSLVEGARF